MGNHLPINCDDGVLFQEVVEGIDARLNVIYGGNATFGPVRKGRNNNVGRHDFATREVVGRGGEMEFFAL